MKILHCDIRVYFISLYRFMRLHIIVFSIVTYFIEAKQRTKKIYIQTYKLTYTSIHSITYTQTYKFTYTYMYNNKEKKYNKWQSKTGTIICGQVGKPAYIYLHI